MINTLVNMKIISHRGNISGPHPELENSPEYIQKALTQGYDVELDVWCINNVWMLGHDEPVYSIDLSFLKNKKLWCHAKNLNALKLMLSEKIHCFWHEEDDYTLTSEGYIWTYPEKHVTPRSVIVCRTGDQLVKLETTPYAICVDDINLHNIYKRLKGH